jgi:hypothetical protein
MALYEESTRANPKRLIQQWNGYAGKAKIKWIGFKGQDSILFSSNLRESTANGYFTINVSAETRLCLLIDEHK